MTLNFEACKNAGIIDAKEADGMKSLLQLINLVHLKVRPHQIPCFDRSELNPKEGHVLDIALDTVAGSPDTFLSTFLKLFNGLHVQDELFHLFEIYSVILDFSPKFQLALKNRIASEREVVQATATHNTSENLIDTFGTINLNSIILGSFIRHFEKSTLHSFVFKQTSYIFKLILDSWGFIPEVALRQFITALCNQISRRDHFSQETTTNSITVHALMDVLKYPKSRIIFHEARGLSALVSLLQPPYSDVQLTYEICFCLWVLSFNEKIIPSFKNDNIIPKLHDVLRVLKVEKVVRIIISTYKNLIAYQGFVSAMISVSIPKTLLLLKKRNFEDADISEIINDISDSITVKMDELSSFDEYRQEVLSGNLQWTPVHTSQKFWKENVKKLQEDDFRMLRALAKMLENSENQNENNLAIACHDLGMFIQFHPRGKRIITEIGAKHSIISLCENPSQEVKKQALSTTQKLLLSSASWF